MRDAWKILCPFFFEQAGDLTETDTNVLTDEVNEIVHLARELNLEVNEGDVLELLDSDDDELTVVQLMELRDDDSDETDTDSVGVEKNLTVSNLKQALDRIRDGMRILEENDADEQ